MFRTLIIAVVASLGLMAPLTLPAATEAHDRLPTYPSYPHHPHRPHVHFYRVYVRDCAHEPWRVYGSYRYADDAYRVARHLRHRGFEAFVR
ncbi:MAG: hypothetical protein FJ303_10430 [Planctomycetes bacterium]|nr:hypothetical protein [Planctomycetota bacterium]